MKLGMEGHVCNFKTQRAEARDSSSRPALATWTLYQKEKKKDIG
jgi:hypothetical protein